MEKSSKAEYVAVPTSDAEHEAGLPPYEEQEAIIAEKSKSRRRFRFLLIGGAVTLLGLTHLCASRARGGFSSMNSMDLRPQDAPEPCALRHLDQYQELKHHMDFLEHDFGEPQFAPHAPQAVEEHRPHHKHHKDFKEKHHKNHDEFVSVQNEEKPHHRHHTYGQGHHGLHKDEQVQSHTKDHHRAHGEGLGCSQHHREDNAVQKHDGGHKKHEPFCKAEDLISKSSIFEFSPEEFKRAAIFSGGFFDRGSHIVLSKSADESLKNVKVNVTISAGRDDLAQEVKVSAFDHDGEYSVQVEHGHFHRPHRHAFKEKGKKEKSHNKKENCLIYNVAVEFPAGLDYFDQLNVKAKDGYFKGGKDIEGVEFGSIKAGIGRGAGLKAKNLLLGVLRGVVMGTYQPSETFSAGTIHGASKVKIEPTAENINITASSIFGPASVDIPADSYKGRFTLFNIFGEASIIEAPNPEDIHVQKFKPTVKSGYYKEDNEQSRIVVAAKLKGGERLTFY
ncbi:hypothetical protein [Parasitella parasitica]|uniref:Uncharacterized protein n=1 Tax=Parasitella parasitica TaxID=35722 RepID=A0A0B7NIK9_9FUNG|nr:hypothetical protein [Parasitella parasitica]